MDIKENELVVDWLWNSLQKISKEVHYDSQPQAIIGLFDTARELEKIRTQLYINEINKIK